MDRKTVTVKDLKQRQSHQWHRINLRGVSGSQGSRSSSGQGWQPYSLQLKRLSAAE